MKHLYSLFILFPLFSFAQWQVSAGADWEFEKLSPGLIKNHAQDSSVERAYWSTHYALSGAYQYQKILFSGEVSYSENSMHVSSSKADDYVSKNYSVRNYYSADVTYSFVGVKLKTQVVLGKKNFNVLFGANVKLDFNTRKEESNHYHREVTHHGNYWGNSGPGEPTEVISNDRFDMFTVLRVVPSTGISISLRYKLKQVFIEAPASLGIQPFHRVNVNSTFVSDDVRGRNPFYYNFGLRLGYIFKKKEDISMRSAVSNYL